MCFSTSSQDYLKDTMDIGEDIIIPESQDTETLAFEPGITYLILVILGHMLSSVKLEYDPFLKAYEVHDICTNGLLPFKFKVVHSFCAEVLPQEAFGISGSFSQIPGALEIDFSHTSLPDPPTQGGEGTR
jgi:hypothetical protein